MWGLVLKRHNVYYISHCDVTPAAKWHWITQWCRIERGIPRRSGSCPFPFGAVTAAQSGMQERDARSLEQFYAITTFNWYKSRQLLHNFQILYFVAGPEMAVVPQARPATAPAADWAAFFLAPSPAARQPPEAVIAQTKRETWQKYTLLKSRSRYMGTVIKRWRRCVLLMF